MPFSFSPSDKHFYPEELRDRYEAAGTLPDDLIEVGDEEAATYMQPPPEGKMRGVDLAGRPAWVDRPPPPPLTTQQQAGLMLTQPLVLTIVCSEVPTLNGAYMIGSDQQTQITGVISKINMGRGLPGGGDTFNWPDASGTVHQWAAPQFIEFADKLSDYIYDLAQTAQGHQPDLPSPTLEI